jgi:hypothetical protein
LVQLEHQGVAIADGTATWSRLLGHPLAKVGEAKV